MRFGVLGPLAVEREGTPLALGPPKQRLLLAAMLARPGQVLSTDRLIDVLWGPRPPRTAVKNLQVYVYHLRQVLGNDNRIGYRPPGYAVVVRDNELDAQRFTELADRGHAAQAEGDVVTADAMLTQALGCWRGAAFADFPDVTWLQGHATRLQEQRLAAVEARIEVDLALGRHAELIGELTELIAEHPLRERLRAAYLLALYRAGRRAEALNAYKQARRTFVDQLGLDPSSALRDLEQAILTDDPSIARPATTSTTRRATPAPDTPATPAQLPPDVADFTGRVRQVRRAEDLLAGRTGSPSRTVTISGAAGVGKTTLAVHVAHRVVAAFPDGQLLANLRGATDDPADIADVLDVFLRALGVDPAGIPDSVVDRTKMYRSRLARRRMLVVLDDARDETQIEPLLPGRHTCAAVITSRPRLTGLPGAEVIGLDTFAADDGVRLISHMVDPDRIDSDPAAVAELVRRCDGLPLALRIAGARLGAKPHWSVRDFVDRISDERRRLDELSYRDLTVRASLALSYDSLDPMARTAFRRLGLLDAPDFAGWVAAAVLDISAEDGDDIVEQLVDVQLIQVVGRDLAGRLRYRLHDLVRVYARERALADDTEADRRAALIRAFGGWLSLADAAHRGVLGGDYTAVYGDAPRWAPDPGLSARLMTTPMTWFESERLAIVMAVRQAARLGFYEQCWELAVRAATGFQLCHYVDDWRHTHEVALAATRQADNQRGVAAVVLGLAAMTLNVERDYVGAERRFADALRRFERIGHTHGCGLALRGLCSGTWQRGDHDRSRRFGERAKQLLHEAGDSGAEAGVILHLGHIPRERGDLDAAAVMYREVLELATTTGDRHHQANASYWLGMIDIERGQPETAQQRFRHTLDLVRRMGDRRGIAYAHHGLGRGYLACEEADGAQGELQRATDINDDERDLRLRVYLLHAWGELNGLIGDTDIALRQLDEAIAIADHVGNPYLRRDIDRTRTELLRGRKPLR